MREERKTVCVQATHAITKGPGAARPKLCAVLSRCAVGPKRLAGLSRCAVGPKRLAVLSRCAALFGRAVPVRLAVLSRCAALFGRAVPVRLAALFGCAVLAGAAVLAGCTEKYTVAHDVPVCGNDRAEPGEECDGSDLDGRTCQNLGLQGGDLGCSEQCTFDVSDCTGTADCGNGLAQYPEQCDGSDLGGFTCLDLGFTGGALGCTLACSFDISACDMGGECGNGVREQPEQCDGADLAGETCGTLGLDGGELHCAGDCTFDVADCTGVPDCGNGAREYPEVCDGADLNQMTCQLLGFYGGSLACLSDCSDFDPSACTGTCGDSVVNGPESCDGADLAAMTCADFGFYGGSLACLADCSGHDTSGCTGRCGDGAVNGQETCDGTDLAGMTCQDFGYYAGNLACLSDCSAHDPSGCSGSCGDNVINGSETCDGTDLGGNDCTTIGMGFTGGTLACAAVCDAWNTASCLSPTCGDGLTETLEKCDDSNLVNGDGCNPTCDLWGTVTTVAGTAGATGFADGIGAAAGFATPAGLASDGSFVYLADAGNCTIRKIQIANWDVSTLAGDPGNCAHADGVGSNALFNIPQDVTYHNGFVYVVDTNNHVIRRVDAATGGATTVAGTPGASGPGDGMGSAARFAEPRGIATDGVYLYVADFGNHTIRRVDMSNWDVVTVAGLAGQFGTSDGQGSQARFNLPRSIDVSGGYVYVADTGNHTIRRIDPSGWNVLTIAGLGGQLGTADGQGSQARFHSPRGLAIDSKSIYVADHGNHAVRQILLGSWDVTTLCGTKGVPGSNDATGTAATLDGPWGLFFDPTLAPPGQRLYVSDSGTNVIRTIE